jgi:hypothetical protein
MELTVEFKVKSISARTKAGLPNGFSIVPVSSRQEPFPSLSVSEADRDILIDNAVKPGQTVRAIVKPGSGIIDGKPISWCSLVEILEVA